MNRRRIHVNLLFAALLLIMPAVHAELIELKWRSGTFMHKASVAPKKFLEVCGKLKKGESINWHYTADMPADFNIHYHVGKDVVYPEKRLASAIAEGTLVAPLEQDFCWMWVNKNEQAIELDVQMKQAAAASN